MTPRRREPADLSEARDRRRSPWRRVFRRRRARRAWYFALILAFALGALVARGILRLPRVGETRFLAPGEPDTPFAVLEVRDALGLWRRNRRVGAVRALVSGPLLKLASTIPAWSMLEDALRPQAGSPPDWRGLAALLGDDATLALYPAATESGPARFLLISKLHPAARVQIAWNMNRPGWRREWQAKRASSDGVTFTRIGMMQPALNVAFMGRLGFGSDDPELLRAAIRSLRGGDAFLRRDETQTEQLRYARLADESDMRVASFYLDPTRLSFGGGLLPSDARAVYGALSQEAGEAGEGWTADLWVVGSFPEPTAQELVTARSMAYRIPTHNPLMFWHSAVPDAWLLRRVPALIGLTWTPNETAGDRANRPIALTVGQASGSAFALLPDAAFMVAARDALRLRNSLRTGNVRLMWRDRRLNVYDAGSVSRLDLPLGMGMSLSLGVGATEDALVIGTTPRAAEAIAGVRPRTSVTALLPESSSPSDLFQLRSHPAELAAALGKLVAAAELAARVSGDVNREDAIRSFRAGLEILGYLSQLDVDALTTLDGLRLFVHIKLGMGSERPAGASG